MFLITELSTFTEESERASGEIDKFLIIVGNCKMSFSGMER